MYCEDCKDKDRCVDLCQKVRRYLSRKESDEKMGIERLYSDRHINRMEIPHDPRLFEEFLPIKAIERICGREVRELDEGREKV